MKAKVFSLFVVLLMNTTLCMAQNRITVEAQSNDISNNLDLKAVASIFGDSKDLEEFEMRLNDYDSQISNLDLNNDGEVDYLRVIETSEDNVHVVVIQAILDRDIFQDVATIVVEKNRYNRTVVQVIGDPYMYGENYIIEPIYYHSPSIFSYFWSRNYRRWYSPYYWGYYPNYYRYRRPIAINIYLSRIHFHINSRYDYRYSNYRRNEHSYNIYKSVRRNDYGVKYPKNNFSSRNKQYKSKKDFEINNNKSINSRSESVRRNIDNSNRNNGSRNYNESGNINRSNTQRSSGNNSGSRAIENNRNNNGTNTQKSESVRRSSGNSSYSPSTRNSNENSGSRVQTQTKNTETKKITPSVKREIQTRKSVPNVNSSRSERSTKSSVNTTKSSNQKVKTDSNSDRTNKTNDSKTQRR